MNHTLETFFIVYFWVAVFQPWLSVEAISPVEHACHAIDLGSSKALYTPGLGIQSGVPKDSMLKVYLGYRNIEEILKLLKKNLN